MATPQLSPGVLVREVDLTVGRADNVLDNIGGLAGPFAIGPIEEPIDITTEQDLINVFGRPISTDGQYEYWMSCSSFLSYGGVLKVVRTDGVDLRSANAKLDSDGTTSIVGDANLKIKNFDDYELNYSDEVANYAYAAKNPGSWANGLKVCVIDDRADQILSVSEVGIATVGYAVAYPFNGDVFAGAGSTVPLDGYLKGIITENDPTAGTISVKVISRVSAAGTETFIDYGALNQSTSFRPSNNLNIISPAGQLAGITTVGASSVAVKDWYDQQTLALENTTIFWSSIAPKPGSSKFARDRSCFSDELHVVVYDDSGAVSGIQANILERHIGISKARDAISAINSPQRIFWKDYIATFSNYLYVGDNPSDGSGNETVVPTGFEADGIGFNPLSIAAGLWNQNAQGVKFSSIGNVTYSLIGGQDYSAAGGMTSTLGEIITGYRLFTNKEEVAVDYLIMGPGLNNKFESQAKAQELISIANGRQDCIAVISPHRADVVDLTNSDTQTDNIVEFFSPLLSSSYAIFDTGYKYTFDRFNNRFRYIPCNPDVAGLCVRTSIQAYPWFSPAGQQRGTINNAIKLAYNPNKAQRDQLYPLRVNSIVNQPGVGVILFGDKTALGFASAFDRINVRRLFLTVEQALQRAAEAQLFELNDEITRANFVNIVEPYLREIQAKRGLYGFLVVCDETNNTPDIIDNNEFRADIYLKPAKSINYVTLTFVATRTGVSFEEVAGRV
jgi:hypothetical protein